MEDRPGQRDDQVVKLLGELQEFYAGRGLHDVCKLLHIYRKDCLEIIRGFIGQADTIRVNLEEKETGGGTDTEEVDRSSLPG